MSDSTSSLIASWSDEEALHRFIEHCLHEGMDQMELHIKQELQRTLESEDCEPIKIVLILESFNQKMEAFNQQLFALIQEYYVKALTIDEMRQLLQLRLEYAELFNKQNQAILAMSLPLGQMSTEFLIDFLQSARVIDQSEMPLAASGTQC